MIINRQMNSISEVCFWIGFGSSVDILIHNIQQYSKKKQERLSFQNQPIITLDELQTQIKTNNFRDGKVIIKTICSKSFTNLYQIQIGSNQVLFDLVPLPKYLEEINANLNHRVAKKDRLKELQWRAEDKCTFKLPIITNSMVLKHTLKYQNIFQTEKVGALKTVYKYAMATLAVLPQVFFQIGRAHRAQDVVISGPTWGNLYISASLATNFPLILCCDVQKGTVIPRYLGMTKQDIISYLKDQQTKYLVYSGVFLTAMYIFYRRSIRKMLRKAVKWCSDFLKGLKGGRELRMYSPQVQQDQSCIICYSRCKNIVFGKCKHMILCDRCAYDETNPVTVCPLCRQEVDAGDYIQLLEYRER